MTKILFVCSANVAQSLNDESIFHKRPGALVKSTGISCDAKMPSFEENLQWADLILCVGNQQKQFIMKNYASFISKKMVESLCIPESYTTIDTNLIDMIEKKAEAVLFKYQLKS